jgi:hypothetical protein
MNINCFEERVYTNVIEAEGPHSPYARGKMNTIRTGNQTPNFKIQIIISFDEMFSAES